MPWRLSRVTSHCNAERRQTNGKLSSVTEGTDLTYASQMRLFAKGSRAPRANT